MIYADYRYYVDEYLCGKGATIPIEDYLYWEKQARREIDHRTFDRIKHLDEDEIPEEVRDCVCAIAEVSYMANQVARMAAEAGAAGPLTSYTNDGQSGTFGSDADGIYTESGKRAEILRLVRHYLGHTGLLYAGVNRCES